MFSALTPPPDPLERRCERARQADRGDRGIVGLAFERRCDPARHVGVVDREAALDARTEDRDL